MNRSAKLHVALAVCVFLFIGLGLALARPGLPDYAPYLSFSPDRDGAKAMRLLMERETGATVKEWRMAPERLPAGEGHVFLSIEPYGMVHESEEALRQWAERGNEVIVFGMHPGLAEDWEVFYLEDEPADDAVTARLPTGETASFRAEVDADVRLELPTNEAVREKEVLQRDAAGVLAFRQPVGAGGVTVAVTGDWWMNENVLAGDRFELLWLLLGGGDTLAGRTVFVDEYHHGYATSPGLTRVYPMWLLAGLAQAALGIAAWIWWRGKRFGPAYTPRAFLVRRGDETLMAVAGWYRRGRLSFEALDFAVERLRVALQSRGGAPASAGANQLAAAVERALEGRRRPPAGLRDTLERWEALRAAKASGGRVDYSDKAWVTDASVLDETMKTLEEER
ncbi:DUF4350 domain-containing protein [Paenibacillus sp. TRM 82003]|nr:DUF4350 domain-containing protein [Paenibacillus sp. TRM 82003]